MSRPPARVLKEAMSQGYCRFFFVFFFDSTIDLIHDTRDLCTRSRTDQWDKSSVTWFLRGLTSEKKIARRRNSG